MCVFIVCVRVRVCRMTALLLVLMDSERNIAGYDVSRGVKATAGQRLCLSRGVWGKQFEHFHQFRPPGAERNKGRRKGRRRLMKGL